MCRSSKLCVAASAAPPARDHDAFVRARKIVDFLTRIFVVNDRTHRHFQDNPFTVAAGFFRAFTMSSALGFIFRIETEMHQRIVALARLHPDVAALAAVAARRAAARNEFLPPERHAAIAAIPSLDSNFGFIDKHECAAQRVRVVSGLRLVKRCAAPQQNESLDGKPRLLWLVWRPGSAPTSRLSGDPT